jgi:putative ABC transport system permease protein
MLMRAWRHLPYDAPDNFAVFGSASIMALWNQITGNLFAVAVALTAVFLVVGGIVIMNIMLASVTERTREIGLRQAVGAKTKDILTQFLVEAVTLSLLGGVIGILLGVLASKLISIFAQWSTLVSPGAILLAFVFSALVGVFFGFYPARKAALLDPIDALRYE